MPGTRPLNGLAQTRQRVLVIDDDPDILRLVRDKLVNAGFEVFTAATGEEALAVIGRKGIPHLAIVDINMPGMDGFQFCQTVHAFCDLPVILLTAVDEEETVIRGIQSYAEDYVTKPFSPRELVVRVQRLLRRMGDYAYTLDSSTPIDHRLTIDFANQQAFVDGQPVSLTPTETKILYILIRNAGQKVTNDFLLRRLWPEEEVFEDTLRVHIARLRKKIEANPSRPQYVITERGIGYSFPTLK
ncbi:MAG: response regulator transcription factor [Anaerolineae bacterium]|nr:response regulator transcription factor [Anaerolineae bacterium]